MLKVLSKELQIPIVCLCQINRSIEKEKEKIRLYSEIAKAANPVVAGAVQSVNPAQKPLEKVSWLCKCGKENKTNFCSECGSQKSFEKWVCSCGTKNSGKFCMECGRKLEEY